MLLVFDDLDFIGEQTDQGGFYWLCLPFPNNETGLQILGGSPERQSASRSYYF